MISIISTQAIRDARESHGISQAELAALLGTTPATISRWETGERMPRAEAARRLAAWLAQSPEPISSKPVEIVSSLSIRIPAKLTELAGEFGVDIESLFATIGAEAVRAELKRRIDERNAEAIRQHNIYIEKHGIPFSDIRAW